MPTYYVRYRSLSSGFPLWRGGPGINVNTGVPQRSSSVVYKDDAIRTASLDKAKRWARDCNENWFGEVVDGRNNVVFVTRRGRPRKESQSCARLS